MSEHTQEPWSVLPQVDDPYEPIRIYGGRDTIAKLWLDDAPVEEYNQQQYANAKRIVACVNFCKGMPTSVLEIEHVDAYFSALKAQRDELLAAAEGIEAWWRLPNIARTVDTIEPPMRAIIEATANAEEDKP